MVLHYTGNEGIQYIAHTLTVRRASTGQLWSKHKIVYIRFIRFSLAVSLKHEFFHLYFFCQFDAKDRHVRYRHCTCLKKTLYP